MVPELNYIRSEAYYIPDIRLSEVSITIYMQGSERVYATSVCA